MPAAHACGLQAVGYGTAKAALPVEPAERLRQPVTELSAASIIARLIRFASRR